MRRIKFWLLGKSDVQTYTIIIVLFLTLVSRYFIDYQIRKTQDYYSPIIFLLLTFWVYYSIFFRVILNNSVSEIIILRNPFDEPKDLSGKFTKLSLLIFFGYQTYYVFGRLGVLISLSIITITGLFCILMIAKNFWQERSRHNNIMEAFGMFIITAGIVGYIYFIPWKISFCYEFGVKEIGNYFEKHTYSAKYLVNICRTNLYNDSAAFDKLDDEYKENDQEALNEIVDNVVAEIEYQKKHTYKLPADIIVSNDFSEYEDYDTESGVGGFSYGITATSETRKVKILKVYFKNGGFLYFSDCFLAVNNSDDCVCVDQNGKEWKVELTKVKVK